jgi:hypothetical protein
VAGSVPTSACLMPLLQLLCCPWHRPSRDATAVSGRHPPCSRPSPNHEATCVPIGALIDHYSAAQGSIASGGRARDDPGAQLALAPGILEHSNFKATPHQNCAIAEPPTHLSPTTNFDPSEYHALLPVPQHPHVHATASHQSLHSQRLIVSFTDVTYE